MARPRIRPLAAACCLASLSACAAPRVGPAHDVSQRASVVLGAPPSVYGPDAAHVPASLAQARVRATFEGALPPAAKATLTHDPALDTVAAVLAEMVSADQQAPSQGLIQWLLWKAGAVTPLSRVVIMTTSGTDDLDFQTADYAGKVQASVYPEAYGLARSSAGRPAEALVVGRRPLAVDPFPRSYAPGAPITLKVKPLDASSDLELLSDDGQGKVAEDRFTAGADGSFSVSRAAPSRPGRYFLEITAADPRTLQATPENPWRRTQLWVPIYVGVPDPAAPDDALRAPAPSPPDAGGWSAKILDLYDEARAREGKPALVRDGRLTTLAQERSSVVARAGREPPPDVVVADKMAASGFPPHDYDEHQARVDSVADYVYLRLLLPSARRRILGSASLAAGVGLTPNAPNAKGEVDYTLVEEDVDPVARFDAARDEPLVVAALDALAKEQGRGPYRHDADVAKVVQAFADEVCRGEKRPNQMKPLVDKARGVGDKYHTWDLPIWRAGYDYTRWQRQSVLARAKQTPLPYAEVGVCQGELPGKVGGSYVVVIQYGP